MAIIKIQNSDLVIDTPVTFLTADTAAGVTSLAVKNITGFATGNTIILGELGDEISEIVSINGAPSGTTITLLAATTFAHNNSTPIRLAQYDQVEFSSATATTGSKSVLTTMNVMADSITTNYIDNSGATGYYFARFKNSVSGLFSTYSDAIPVSGYASNTLWSCKDRALRELGEVRSDLISEQFLNDSVAEGRRLADQNPATFRWSFRQKFGQVIAQMLSGQWRIAAPTDIRDPNTYKNVLSLRIGNQNRPVMYQDRVRFNQNYLNVVHTTVATAYVSGALSLVLTSTHDLDTTGSITIANNAVANGLIAVAYSANDKSTNTLTIANAGRNIAAGTDVWQRATFGLPTGYTIDSGYIYFDVPLNLNSDGMDVKGDYYAKLTEMTADSDTFDEPFYDLYVSWLKWKIKYAKANGKIDRDGDTDYKDFVTGLSALIGQETTGQRVNYVPDVEGYLSATE